MHLIGQDPLPDGDGKFRVETGGGSDLARISLSLRHNTAYRPHEVRASIHECVTYTLVSLQIPLNVRYIIMIDTLKSMAYVLLIMKVKV